MGKMENQEKVRYCEKCGGKTIVTYRRIFGREGNEQGKDLFDECVRCGHRRRF